MTSALVSGADREGRRGRGDVDPELTTSEIVEDAEPPAITVRRELLHALAGKMEQLSEHASLLAPKLHNVVRVQSFREVLTALQSGRITVGDILFWSYLTDTSNRVTGFTTSSRGSESAELWNLLEVPEVTASLFESMGFNPDDYFKCFGTPAMSSQSLMRWASSEIPMKDIRSWIMSGVPDPDTATKWMGELRETPEAVMIHYRNFHGDFYRAKAWRLQAAGQTSVQNIVITAPPEVFRKLPEPVRVQSQAAPIGKMPSKSHDWLEEIIARARTVQPSIRKVPHWPAHVDFPDEGLAIQLEQFPRFIQGVVIVGRDRRWCQFDPSTFVILSRCASGEDRYVAGMSISWFIDCSIAIHLNSSGSTRLFSAESTTSNRKQKHRIRYIPTPTFRDRQREVQTSGRSLTIRHKVAGHVRKLPPGRKASKEARSKAPDHVRRNMLNSETYVESHFRGTEAEKAELFTRLSRYSALGEAMSGLE